MAFSWLHKVADVLKHFTANTKLLKKNKDSFQGLAVLGMQNV